MSATLSWFNSGLGTKTGTTVAACITDIVSLFTAVSGGASYSWEVASSTTGSSPNYIVLRPKSLAAGRILITVWTSSPAGNNAAILDGSPVNNSLYVSYFPAGNVNTPSNLTAASGTILGDDTGAVKVSFGVLVSTIYAANFQPFYFDSAEAVFFGFQNPASSTGYGVGAGALLVDSADTVYPAIVSFGNGSTGVFGNSTSGLMLWTTTAQPAGTANQQVCRTNYGAANRVYFSGWIPSGNWCNAVVGPNDILTDTGTNRVWHVASQLLGTTKGEGFVLKLRQIAYGPGTVGPFTAYQITGPVVSSRQFNAATAGGTGYPWFTNFKL